MGVVVRLIEPIMDNFVVEKNLDGQSLGVLIPEKVREKITVLKLNGYVTSEDMHFIRALSGAEEDMYQGVKGNLKVIDLSNIQDILATDNNDYYRYKELVNFKGCKSLKEIKLAKHIKTIDFDSFDDCDSLERIECPSPSHGYESKDGVLYLCGMDNGYKTWLVRYPQNRATEDYTLIPNVNRVKRHAFKDCHLKSIKINQPIPPNCEGDAFEGVEKDKITLHVPKGSYNNYLAASEWTDFNIQDDL